MTVSAGIEAAAFALTAEVPVTDCKTPVPPDLATTKALTVAAEEVVVRLPH